MNLITGASRKSDQRVGENKFKEMSTENKFTVDLGSIKLSPEQHTKINTAIQKAVSSELANISSTEKIILIPVNKWIKGPILDGIIARELNEGLLNQILKL
jgi:hypothetical protein